MANQTLRNQIKTLRNIHSFTQTFSSTSANFQPSFPGFYLPANCTAHKRPFVGFLYEFLNCFLFLFIVENCKQSYNVSLGNQARLLAWSAANKWTFWEYLRENSQRNQ
jgi:hypothetical protein